VDGQSSQVFVSEGRLPGDLVKKLANCFIQYTEEDLNQLPAEDAYANIQENILDALEKLNNKG
jgi:hypothetical protein